MKKNEKLMIMVGDLLNDYLRENKSFLIFSCDAFISRLASAFEDDEDLKTIEAMCEEFLNNKKNKAESLMDLDKLICNEYFNDDILSMDCFKKHETLVETLEILEIETIEEYVNLSIDVKLLILFVKPDLLTDLHILKYHPTKDIDAVLNDFYSNYKEKDLLFLSNMILFSNKSDDCSITKKDLYELDDDQYAKYEANMIKKTIRLFETYQIVLGKFINAILDENNYVSFSKIESAIRHSMYRDKLIALLRIVYPHIFNDLEFKEYISCHWRKIDYVYNKDGQYRSKYSPFINDGRYDNIPNDFTKKTYYKVLDIFTNYFFYTTSSFLLANDEILYFKNRGFNCIGKVIGTCEFSKDDDKYNKTLVLPFNWLKVSKIEFINMEITNYSHESVVAHDCYLTDNELRVFKPGVYFASDGFIATDAPGKCKDKTMTRFIIVNSSGTKVADHIKSVEQGRFVVTEVVNWWETKIIVIVKIPKTYFTNQILYIDKNLLHSAFLLEKLLETNGEPTLSPIYYKDIDTKVGFPKENGWFINLSRLDFKVDSLFGII